MNICRSILRRPVQLAPLATGLFLALLLLPAPAQAQDEAPAPPQANPALDSLRASNPTTAAELVQALRITTGFGRYDQAEMYLEKLLELELELEDLVALQAEFGSAPFMRMMLDEQFPEEGRIFAGAVLEAAHTYATDPARLQQMVDKLSAEDEAVRGAALVGLVRGGEASVAPLLAAVGNPRQYPETARYQAALVQIGQPAVGPLVAAISVTDQATRADVIETLGRMEDNSVLPYLVRPLLDAQASDEVHAAAADAFVRLIGEVPSINTAERYLAGKVRDYYAGQVHFSTDDNDLTRVWRWDQGQAVPLRVPPFIAQRIVASDLARDLAALWPDRLEYRRMYLASLLEAEKSRVGLAMPMPTGPRTVVEEATEAGNAALVDVLNEALRTHRPIAAMAACEVLGETGDLSLLDSVGGEKSALARALSYPNRRVQFFAAQAILKLDPTEAFAGSDDLTQTLGYIGRSSADRQVLVASAHTQNLLRVTGLLNGLGYETDAVATGRDVMLEALRSPDIEFVILSDSLNSSNPGEVLQELRKDPRTASLPVGIIASEDNFESMQRLAEDFPPAVAFPLPVEETALVDHTSRLIVMAGEHFVPRAERVAMARAALTWLTQLAGDPEKYDFYNLLVQEQPALAALASPETSVQAAALLGELATPAAQSALVDVASQNTQPLEVRQAAAAALGVAVERRGLLLTTDQILLQYERYNQSESLDRETQAVLGSVLDVIEAPTKATAAE